MLQIAVESSASLRECRLRDFFPKRPIVSSRAFKGLPNVDVVFPVPSVNDLGAKTEAPEVVRDFVRTTDRGIRPIATTLELKQVDVC